MTDKPRHLDPVEDALIELHSAQQAGVFGQTCADPAKLVLLDPSAKTIIRSHRALRWISIAAVLALSVGVWSMRSGLQSGLPIEAGTGVTALDGDVALCDGSFYGCLSGPTVRLAMASRCLIYDYDGDGDVDLADTSAHQRACLGPQVRNR